MIKDNDIILSSRVRFARNIKDYPYASKLDKTSCNEIIEKVGAVFPDFQKTDFTTMNPLEAQTYVENHTVSPEFAQSKRPHALYEKGDTKIMVCEEDHVRLQVIKPGFSISEAFEEACEYDDILIDNLRIAYDEELGFLTHCPTNLGSGMRASVMMFLPALTMTRELDSIVAQLSKLGLTIRGIYGEGSEALGYIYQISNTETMGATEEATINKLSEIVTQIIDYERKARERIKKNGAANADPITRALGILLYSSLLSSSEFISLYAKVRLGVAIGLIEGISYEALDALFTDVMPATLTAGEQLTEVARDEKRAKTVRENLRRM